MFMAIADENRKMKSTNKMLCLVNLPNGTTFGIQCDPKAIGQKCLEEVSFFFAVHIALLQSTLKIYFKKGRRKLTNRIQ